MEDQLTVIISNSYDTDRKVKIFDFYNLDRRSNPLCYVSYKCGGNVGLFSQLFGGANINVFAIKMICDGHTKSYKKIGGRSTSAQYVRAIKFHDGSLGSDGGSPRSIKPIDHFSVNQYLNTTINVDLTDNPIPISTNTVGELLIAPNTTMKIVMYVSGLKRLLSAHQYSNALER